MPRIRFIPLIAIVGLSGVGARAQANPSDAGGVTIRTVLPTDADPALQTRFNAPNLVFIPEHIRHRELVVFFPGTHGEPAGYKGLLENVAAAGIRVVGLMYNDVPTSRAACAGRDDATCTGSFRRERVDGGVTDAAVQNTVEESIHDRLVKLLEYEAKQYPAEGWGEFLSHDQPKWRRLIVSGHSQGAGMAAFIGKRHRVARVVLFSGGPDGYGYRSGTPKVSAWVRMPSKTPMQQWWAEYHTREPSAKLLPAGYAALKIPAAHVLVFDPDLPPGMHSKGPVAYHMTVIHDPRYRPQWKKMFGVDRFDAQKQVPGGAAARPNPETP